MILKTGCPVESIECFKNTDVQAPPQETWFSWPECHTLVFSTISLIDSYVQAGLIISDLQLHVPKCDH